MQWNPVFSRLACVGLVVALMFPLGRMVFPLVGHVIGDMQFGAIEALLSTAMGMGLHGALFS